MNRQCDFTDVRFTLMKALLHRIRPNVRSVAVAMENSILRIRFCLDGSISELDRELFQAAVNEMKKDFEGSFETKAEIIQVDFPQPRPQEMFHVYARYEDGMI